MLKCICWYRIINDPLSCLKCRIKTEFLSKKWLNMKKRVAYKEILLLANKGFAADLCRYL